MDAVPESENNQPQRLTSNGSNNDGPAFSPDGTKIAFSGFQDHSNEIYVMDAVDSDGDGNGDNLTRLTNNSDFDAFPTWSPDGQQIAFGGQRPSIWVILVMDAVDGDDDGNGDNQTQLTNSAAGFVTPSWSPDGQKIAFHDDRDGNSEIYSMNAAPEGPANEPQRLTFNSAFDADPAWGVCTGVNAVSPSENATKMLRNTNVTATFCSEIDPSTLDSSTFTLTKAGTITPVSATVTYDPIAHKVTLNPFGSSTQKLSKKKVYTAKISGVKDLADNPLPDIVWSFKTGRK
jgi:dipeptidyl aminopeptidase/acylaminoacyl peptidase